MSVLLKTMLPQIQALAAELSYPEAVLEPMLKAAETLKKELPLENLADPAACEQAWQEISAVLPPWQEDQGMAQLAVTTAAACLTRKNYEKLHISDRVFLDTMKAIPRFILESRDLHGKWVYDRGFWTWRQTGCLLFRLGALEFEYRLLSPSEALPQGLSVGGPILSVHIPSDAQMNREALDHSYGWAKTFFYGETLGPWTENPPKAILCDTWLLAETLQELLPETSGIRRFAADYRLYSAVEDTEDFFYWLYQLAAPLPYDQLPEHTSLQRKLKAHLLAGGHMGTGAGILIR